jgi:mono/diheme cytochrome c family protein
VVPSPFQGKGLFDKHCATCHGLDLKGSDKGPPFLHPVYEPAHHGDTSFQMAVKFGSRAHHWRFGDMPPVQGVTADDVAHITAYVRQKQRQAGIQ